MPTSGGGAAARLSTRWIHGRWTDLLFGAGLGYLVLLPPSVSFGITEIGVLVTIATDALVNTAHFGGTLLRAYERSEDRQRYAAYTIHATLILSLLFAAGLSNLWLGSLLITIYLSWSPWHLASQNYGVARLFLARSDVAVDSTTRTLLRLSFLLSSCVDLLFLHAAVSFARYLPELDDSYRVLNLGLPDAATAVLFPALLLGYAIALGAAALRLLRSSASMRQIAPAALVAVMHALWFVVPGAFLYEGARLTTFLFVASGRSLFHALQTIWLTSYYAQRSQPGSRSISHIAKAILVGNAPFVLPLLLAPAAIGGSSWARGPFFLLFAVVSIHHFLLDGVIWKLRDPGVSQLLVNARPTTRVASAIRQRGWARHAVRFAGAVVLVGALVDFEANRSMDHADTSALERAAAHLEFFGRGNGGVLDTLSQHYIDEGRFDEAEAALRKSIALDRDATLLNNLAWLLAARGDAKHAPEALSLATEARNREGGGRDPHIMDTLALASAVNGRCRDAQRQARRARDLAVEQNDPAAAEIAQRLAHYESGCGQPLGHDLRSSKAGGRRAGSQS